MSSALLKFQEPDPGAIDLTILAAAVEASPQALAITENGRLIFKNRSFAQLTCNGPDPTFASPALESIPFVVAGREFSLTTAEAGATAERSNLQQLAVMGRMVAGVAHDFNNLLTGILLYCDLLQSKAESTGALWKKTEEIRCAAEQGAGLIRQLMTVGLEQPGGPPSVYFNEIARELEPLLRHLIGERIQIVMDLADDPVQVEISTAQAQQIVLNLALNARDAMPNGGALRFESGCRELNGNGCRVQTFEFTVSDTGQGMDEGTAARAFDPFFSTKAAGRGTGLDTVRGIVEAAGGNVSVESSPGKGTRMMVRLPAGARNSQENQAIRLTRRSTPKPSEDRGVAQ